MSLPATAITPTPATPITSTVDPGPVPLDLPFLAVLFTAIIFTVLFCYYFEYCDICTRVRRRMKSGSKKASFAGSHASLRKLEEGNTVTCDVFVCYCTATKDWLNKQLLPRLWKLKIGSQYTSVVYPHDLEVPTKIITNNFRETFEKSSVIIMLVSEELGTQYCGKYNELFAEISHTAMGEKLLLPIVFPGGDCSKLTNLIQSRLVGATQYHLPNDAKERDEFWKVLLQCVQEKLEKHGEHNSGFLSDEDDTNIL